MPNYVEKNVRYVHFAEKCSNMRNMQQSHICIKPTCLVHIHFCLYTGSYVFDMSD